MLREHNHWLFAWVPIAGSVVWFGPHFRNPPYEFLVGRPLTLTLFSLGTILAMLVTWLAEGRPRYSEQESNVAYISDVGADRLKPLFITGCSLTAVSFIVSLIIERWLRHSGRLRPNMRKRERVFSSLSILSSFFGGGALILLSIFDTRRHSFLHRLFLLIFMVGVIFSTLFTVVEYRWISKSYSHIRRLKLAYSAKAIIAGILFVLAVAFAIALFRAPFVGGIIEWTIAFGFTFYMLTFYYDLRLAKGNYKGKYTDESVRLGDERSARAGNVEGSPGRSTAESEPSHLPSMSQV